MLDRKNGWEPGVADTAFWVALYRARESMRDDRLFADRWAMRLVGNDNKRELEKIPHIYLGEWKYALRTVSIDRYIQKVLADDLVDVVVNLGAGLDMRPYRLSIPRHIVWVEVDLPGIIQYKEERLGTCVPSPLPYCALHRIRCDLSVPAQRAQAFSRIATYGKRWLVITEGLLIYLDPSSVGPFMKEVGSYCDVGYWASDYVTDLNFIWNKKKVDSLLQYLKTVENNELTFKFCVPREEGARHFSSYGWHLQEDRSIFDSAFLFGRRPPLLLRLLAMVGWSAKSEHIRGMNGCCLLKKSSGS